MDDVKPLSCEELSEARRAWEHEGSWLERCLFLTLDEWGATANTLRAQLAECEKQNAVLPDLEGENDALRDDVRDLRESLTTLRAQLDEARGMRGADAGERWYLKNLQAANQDYAKQITTLRAQLAEAQAEIRRLKEGVKIEWPAGGFDGHSDPYAPPRR